MLLAGSIARAIDLMQADCGKILGIGQAQLSKYEKGQYVQTLDLLLKLRSYSGGSIDWIVTGEEVGRREYRPTLLRPRSASLTGWRRIPEEPHAVALGRLGGAKGGRVRAQRQTPEQRKVLARKAAPARRSKGSTNK